MPLYPRIPLPLRRLAWEKILAIGERTPEILRGCAFEYELFWRGAHEVAKQLREEADRMEATQRGADAEEHS